MSCQVLYLDRGITERLKQLPNCPNIVYRKIWQFVPNTTRPEIPELNEHLYKGVLLFGRNNTKTQRDHLMKMYKLFKSYYSIIKIIRSMENDPYIQSFVFKIPAKNRFIRMGSYVKFRENLREFGLV